MCNKCEKTEFGCCLDLENAARGPDFDGCPTGNDTMAFTDCTITVRRKGQEEGEEKGLDKNCQTERYWQSHAFITWYGFLFSGSHLQSQMITPAATSDHTCSHRWSHLSIVAVCTVQVTLYRYKKGHPGMMDDSIAHILLTRSTGAALTGRRRPAGRTFAVASPPRRAPTPAGGAARTCSIRRTDRTGRDAASPRSTDAARTASGQQR